MEWKTRKGKILSFSFSQPTRDLFTAEQAWGLAIVLGSQIQQYLYVLALVSIRRGKGHAYNIKHGWENAFYCKGISQKPFFTADAVATDTGKIAFCERQFPFLYVAVLFPRKQNCSSRAELLISLQDFAPRSCYSRALPFARSWLCAVDSIRA
jgi:hypothetical protein